MEFFLIQKQLIYEKYNMKKTDTLKWIFFGTDEFAVIILDSLKNKGMIPSLIICAPDIPMRRKKGFIPPATKMWAQENKVNIVQPQILDEMFIEAISTDLWDFFVVASYGKIIPQALLNIPRKGTLNVHPSLLPQYRGASPVETAIIDDCKHTGVTIMEMDSKMDHGPIISQVHYTFDSWPTSNKARIQLATIGGDELARIIPMWIHNSLDSVEQNHGKATFTKKFSKDDALIELDGNPYENFRKIQAFSGWNDAYFFIQNNNAKTRVIIKEAQYNNGALEIIRVVPEGKKEMSFEQFRSSIHSQQHLK